MAAKNFSSVSVRNSSDEGLWKALLEEDKTFLNVTFLDADDEQVNQPLRRYRSEPDFSKIARMENETHKEVIVSDPFCTAQDDISSCKYSSQASTMSPMSIRSLESDASSDKSDCDASAYKSEQSASSMKGYLLHTLTHPVVAPRQDQDSKRLAQVAQKRVRPCKGKRERCRKFICKLMEQIDAEPQEFNIESVTLPPTLFFNDYQKEKLISRMQTYHAWALHASRAQGSVGSGRNFKDVESFLHSTASHVMS